MPEKLGRYLSGLIRTYRPLDKGGIILHRVYELVQLRVALYVEAKILNTANFEGPLTVSVQPPAKRDIEAPTRPLRHRQRHFEYFGGHI